MLFSIRTVFILFLLSQMWQSCRNNEVTTSDKTNKLIIKYNNDKTMLKININRIPTEKENEQVLLYQFESGFYYGRDSIVLNSPYTISTIMIHKDNKGLYNLGDDNNASFLIGAEDTIIINCNYKTLVENGDIEIISRENTHYSNSLNISAIEFKERNEIEQNWKSFTYAHPKYISLQKEGKEKLEKHWRMYNNKFDSIAHFIPGSYLTEILIPIFKTPLRTPKDDYGNYQSFLYKNYFRDVATDNKDILNSPFFYQFINNYLNYYKGTSRKEYFDGAFHLLEANSYNADVKDFVQNVLIDFYIQLDFAGLAKDIAMIGEEGCGDEILAEIDVSVGFNKGLPIGNNVPNIEFADFNLYNTFGNHDATFLYFWKTGCAQCKREHAEIKEVYDQLLAKNINVVGFGLDSDNEKFQETILGLPWNNISDLKGVKSEYIQSFRLKSTPSTFLLDRNGKLLYKQISISELIKKIN